jgi:predicted secreted protein
VTDVPEELRLNVGEEQTVRLPGLATAGYRWQAAVDDEKVATVSSRFEAGTEKLESKAASSRDELVMVTGQAVGTTRLSLVQRRSWEGDVAPIAAHTLTITVVAAADSNPVQEGGRSEH